MITIQYRLAKNYAKAFLSFLKRSLTAQELSHLERLETFLMNNKLVLAFLSVPTFPLKKKEALVDHILMYFTLPDEFKTLIQSLVQCNRASFLLKILASIRLCQREFHKIETFEVVSSHELTLHEKESVVSFICKSIPCQILTNFQVNPALISGLRIQSDHYYWERSVAKQLKSITQTLHQQGAV